MDYSNAADLLAYKERITKRIQPIKPANNLITPYRGFINSSRTDGGRTLNEYFLVYFLLVELLGFENLGKGDKVAWSVPIEFNGKLFFIEHRKMGLGIFGKDVHDPDAFAIAKLINTATGMATGYFAWLAEKAANDSRLNLLNRSTKLLKRFNYFLEKYEAKTNELEIAEEQKKKDKGERYVDFGIYSEEQDWLALSAIDAFFSWTEHLFIHMAVLNGKITTGVQVGELAKGEWSEKYKLAIGITEKAAEKYYNDLVIIRREVRNYVAHGSFGKDGRAFNIHSAAGAVPLLLTIRGGRPQFSFYDDLLFGDKKAITIIKSFIADVLWSGVRAPAKLYIQDADFPSILTMASDGQYEMAMQSIESMEAFVYDLHMQFDRAMDMDF